jgi:hypothetical protein
VSFCPNNTYILFVTYVILVTIVKKAVIHKLVAGETTWQRIVVLGQAAAAQEASRAYHALLMRQSLLRPSLPVVAAAVVLRVRVLLLMTLTAAVS